MLGKSWKYQISVFSIFLENRWKKINWGWFRYWPRCFQTIPSTQTLFFYWKGGKTTANFMLYLTRPTTITFPPSTRHLEVVQASIKHWVSTHPHRRLSDFSPVLHQTWNTKCDTKTNSKIPTRLVQRFATCLSCLTSCHVPEKFCFPSFHVNFSCFHLTASLHFLEMIRKLCA